MTPSAPAPSALLQATRVLAKQRWQFAALLTLCMVGVYFSFIGLVAFRPAWLATPLGDGLTLGILLGALVIVATWLLTLSYVSWANRVYDPALLALRATQQAAREAAATTGATSTETR